SVAALLLQRGQRGLGLGHPGLDRVPPPRPQLFDAGGFRPQHRLLLPQLRLRLLDALPVGAVVFQRPDPLPRRRHPLPRRRHLVRSFGDGGLVLGDVGKAGPVGGFRLLVLVVDRHQRVAELVAEPQLFHHLRWSLPPRRDAVPVHQLHVRSPAVSGRCGRPGPAGGPWPRGWWTPTTTAPARAPSRPGPAATTCCSTPPGWPGRLPGRRRRRRTAPRRRSPAGRGTPALPG